MQLKKLQVSIYREISVQKELCTRACIRSSHGHKGIILILDVLTHIPSKDLNY